MMLKELFNAELRLLFIFVPGERFNAGELVRVPHGDQRVRAARGKVLAALGELDTDAVAGMSLHTETSLLKKAEKNGLT